MNKQEIRDLMKFFDKSSISKVKIKDGDFSIELLKGLDTVVAPVQTQTTSVVAKTIAEPEETVVEMKNVVKDDTLTINSPMVGTFYVAPSPGSEPFVKVGSVVREGQTIAIIEAMKIMNEIEAEFDCRISEVLASDGQPVEFGLPLFAVEKV